MVEVIEVLYEEIEKCDGFFDLISEYSKESSSPVTPNAQPMAERYRMMTELGAIRLLGAFDGEKVVGLAGVAVAKTQMHSSAPICSIESFYLRKEYRQGANGLKLLNAAKAVAKEAGAPGLLIATPTEGSYNALCSALGMKHLQNLWWCAL